MRGEQATFNLEIKIKSGLSINHDIHHSKVFSSGYITLDKVYNYKLYKNDIFTQINYKYNWWLN